MTDRDTPQPGSKPGLMRRSLAVALLAGTALAGGLSLADAPGAVAAVPATALPAGGFADLVERVSPAVVTVTATRDAEEAELPTAELPPGMQDFLRRFGGPDHQGRRGPPGMEQARSLGSGFVFDAEGYIVTNRHVVEGATAVTVTLQDGRELKASVVGADDKTDLAVLKAEADAPLPSLAFADSDKVRVGDVVLAVGNPFGLGGTVTAGIVSARGRDINSGPYDDYIQLDAAINRGNSGGPTFNAAGEVVGINTAIFSPNGGSVGIGFAIPSNLAKPVVEQLKRDGRVERGWLGVQLQGLNPALAEGLGLKDERGALIAGVQPDGPAAKAGLKSGDVVLKAGAAEVKTSRDLARAVGSVQPGTELPLTVWRDGRERTLAVAVAEAPGQPRVVQAAAAAREDVAGLTLGTLDDAWRQRLELPEDARGVVVVGVDRRGADLRPGDLIQSVNNEPVAAPAEVAEKVKAAEKAGRKNALLLVRRGEGTAFVALPVGQA